MYLDNDRFDFDAIYVVYCKGWILITELIFMLQLAIISLLLVPFISMKCLSPIYCKGPILHAIQTSNIFNDSKTFVDMPTVKSEEEVIILLC